MNKYTMRPSILMVWRSEAPLYLKFENNNSNSKIYWYITTKYADASVFFTEHDILAAEQILEKEFISTPMDGIGIYRHVYLCIETITNQLADL